MRLPVTLDRRQALGRALVALAASSAPALHSARPADAAAIGSGLYTIVPMGTIAAKQSKLAEVQKQFAVAPDDPYVFGEKAQLEADIAGLQKNKAFVEKIAADVAAGRQSFLQSLRVGVPDMQDALQFWTRGCGAVVQSTAIIDGANVTSVGFGPAHLQGDDGAKFSLQLVEGTSSSFGPGNSLEYVQLAIPVFRLSQVMANGGDVVSAYGWSEVIAPGGLPLRVRIDETRRDPFEFVAVRTSDLRNAMQHYQSFGMGKIDEKSAKKRLRLTEYSNSLFEADNALEPDREAGSVLMGDSSAAALTTGVLLLPPRKINTKPIAGPMPPQLRFVGATAGEARGADGIQSVLIAAGDL